MSPTLEDRVEACVRLWDLKLGEQFERSYNFVFAAERRGAPVVLKLGCPGEYDLSREASALGFFGGHGMVRLLERDVEQGAMLLERAVPGATLLGLALRDDERATSIAADVMRRLWRPAPSDSGYPSVADWGEGFARHRARFGGSGPLPSMRYDQAERLFAELLSSAAAQVLLHGDLHHFNILSAERSPWLAIDPKGVIGEPAYEAGALLRNPFPKLLDLDDPGRLQSRRVSILAEALDLDARRIRGWAVAQAVLAAVWSIEDDESVNDYWVTCADLLAEGDLG
jgi:streptomycin 6-kinase